MGLFNVNVNLSNPGYQGLKVKRLWDLSVYINQKRQLIIFIHPHMLGIGSSPVSWFAYVGGI